MRVDSKTIGQVNAAGTRRAGASGARFDADGPEPSARASSSSATAAPQSLDALIALQAQDDPADRRRRRVAHGQSLLDALDRLKAALLGGRVAPAELLRIVALIGQRPDMSGDPRLDDLIAQIELRAQVELAKLGH